MKKIGMLFIIYVLLLAGCEVAEKMVIQYEDYQETVLSERFESELGFSMQVKHGMEVREDIEEKRVEFAEPFQMSISVIDKQDEKDTIWNAIYNEFSLFGLPYYDPASIKIDNFDIAFIGRKGKEPLLYIVKEAKELFFMVELLINLDQFEEEFPLVRSMLSSINYSEDLLLEIPSQNAFSYLFLPPYRGEVNGLQFNYFRYELDKISRSEYEQLSSKYGEPIDLDDKSSYYSSWIYQELNFQSPTGKYFTSFEEIGIGIMESRRNSQSVRTNYYLHLGTNGFAAFELHHLPLSMTLRYTFAEIDQLTDQIHIITEEDIPITEVYHYFEVNFLDKKDTYYLVYVELLGDDGQIEDSMEKIFYVPPYQVAASVSLDKHNTEVGAPLQLEISHEGTYETIIINEPIIEMYMDEEWWVIPYDGHFQHESVFGGLYHVEPNNSFLFESVDTTGLAPGDYRAVISLLYLKTNTIHHEELPVEEMVLAVPFTIK